MQIPCILLDKFESLLNSSVRNYTVLALNRTWIHPNTNQYHNCYICRLPVWIVVTKFQHFGQKKCTLRRTAYSSATAIWNVFIIWTVHRDFLNTHTFPYDGISQSDYRLKIIIQAFNQSAEFNTILLSNLQNCHLHLLVRR